MGSEISVFINTASPPLSLILLAVLLPDSSLKSIQATYAPFEAISYAIASPIPSTAPVTTAPNLSSFPIDYLQMIKYV